MRTTHLISLLQIYLKMYFVYRDVSGRPFLFCKIILFRLAAVV